MYKIDLHTHSIASPDGGITLQQYQAILRSRTLDAIAITDHNRIDFALDARAKLGDRIIVGEEIMTREGEIIGLFLSTVIPSGLPLSETIELIKQQGGIVYVPHPFETYRSGIHPQVLESVQDAIDLIEICNGRAITQQRNKQALVWAKLNNKPGCASSDAHGKGGLGTTYTAFKALPSQANIIKLARLGIPMTKRPTIRAILYPKYHRSKKKVKGLWTK